MDKVRGNVDLAVVAASEASDPNQRHDLIAKADRERELGDFSKALALYREAEAMHDDLSMSLKIASLMTGQGRIPMALRELDQALGKYARIEVDRELVAVAQMLRAAHAAMMDLEFSPALERGLKYFDEFVKPYPPREWKGWKLAIAFLLAPLHSLLTMNGANLDPLPWDATTIPEVYKELVRIDRFDKAYEAACLPNHGRPQFEGWNMSLMDDLLQQPKLPALVRAEILQLKGKLALHSGDRDLWALMSEEANRIFLAEGHRSGPLRIEMERLEHDTQMKLPYAELKSAVIRIRARFVELGDWLGVKFCMMYLSTMAIRHADDQLLGQLDDQYEAMRTDCFTTLEWADKESLMLGSWDVQNQHVAKLIATTEESYQTYVDGGMPLRAAFAACTLFKSYLWIGDEQKADDWASRATTRAGLESLRPQHLGPPLIRRLKEAKGDKILLPVAAEREWLSSFLAEKKARYDGKTSRFERVEIIQSILLVQGPYLFRFDGYKKLAMMCMEAVRELLPLLPPHDRATYEAQLLDRAADMTFTDALLHESRELMVDAYNAWAEAAGILESIGDRGIQLSGCYAGMGTVARELWVVHPSAGARGAIRDSLFQEANYFFCASLAHVAEEQQLLSAQLAITRLHGLWLLGLKSAVAADGTSGTEDGDIAVARDITHMYLATGEELLGLSRRDSSTLPKRSAVVGQAVGEGGAGSEKALF